MNSWCSWYASCVLLHCVLQYLLQYLLHGVLVRSKCPSQVEVDAQELLPHPAFKRLLGWDIVDAGRDAGLIIEHVSVSESKAEVEAKVELGVEPGGDVGDMVFELGIRSAAAVPVVVAAKGARAAHESDGEVGGEPGLHGHEHGLGV